MMNQISSFQSSSALLRGGNGGFRKAGAPPATRSRPLEAATLFDADRPDMIMTFSHESMR
jgi:hypothetical protein